MEALRKDYNRLKKLYEKAVKNNKAQFTFEGQPVLVRYAKYYLEYLEGVLKDVQSKTKATDSQ